MNATPPSPAKSRRGAGRPSRDEPDLRSHLLDVAIARFARDGIAATSLRTIASEAGVTPAMLHYYFGDKQQLKQALIAERFLPAVIPVREQLMATREVTELVTAFVTGVAEAIKQNPWLPSLWVREVLTEGGELRDVLFNEAVPNLPRIMSERFASAQREGHINPDLDPRLIMVSLIGLTMFPAASAPLWQRLFDADDLGPDALARHAMALLSAGMLLPSGVERP